MTDLTSAHAAPGGRVARGRTAERQDARLNFAAHPLAWLAATLVRPLGAVVRIPGLGAIVNHLDIAHEILSRDTEFTKNGPGSIAAVFTQAMGPFALANMDGEGHRQLRARLGDLLTSSRCSALLDASRDPLDVACARLARGETVDLVDMARTLSGRLTMEMMGITPAAPDRDHAAREIFALGERIAAALQLRPLSGSRLARVQEDLDRLTSHARGAYDDPTPVPGSLVLRLREMGLSREEARGVLSIFFVAGTLTVAVALPRVVALLTDSGAWEELRANPTLVAPALDECLRFTTPVPATVRISQGADVRGHHFARGTRVVILTANLGRDPTVFDDPNRLDIHRAFDPRSRYLWYGYGPHFCLGFPLAQREMQLVIGELLRLPPGRLRVVRRKAARQVLLPAYARLDVVLGRS
jgi:cytochrome P450